MVSQVFTQPGSALWLYVFVVLIIIVLLLIGSNMMPSNMDRHGARLKVGLGFLIIAIVLGIVIYFLIASNIEQWAWFIALLPTAILLFAIYFAFFGAMGNIMLIIGTFIALFVMIWVIYYAFANGQWSLLAFPIIYIILAIMGGVGWGMWNKNGKSRRSTRREMSESALSEPSLEDIVGESESGSL